MTPVILTKNIEINNGRWKPAVSVVEENVNSLSPSDLPQSFIASDGNLYYWPSEIVTSYPASAVIEQIQENRPVVNSKDNKIYNSQTNGQEGINQSNDLPHGELKRLIQLQFEYYFSRENLANDSYLVSQMDGDQYVFISTIAKFNQIRKLTSDMKLIVDALKESPYVQLDKSEKKVRANMKRCIVILREIPESTPIEEVKALFSHPNCPPWVSFEFAHNDSWYVTFNGEEDAKIAYRYLREEVQHFHGRPLMARIKAKTLLSRTVYLPKSANTSPSAIVTCTSPSGNGTQYSQPPINTFAIPPNAVFHQTQSFPFYATTSVNSNSIMPGTWLGPRLFIQQEIQPKSNFNSHKTSDFQFMSNKGRVWNRNHKNQKILTTARNGILDNDDRHLISSLKRSQNPNISCNSFSAFKRDESRFMRAGGNTKKDFRSNIEEGPRFQRLREKKFKEEIKSFKVKESDETVKCANLTLDLAMENFPALPSPNSSNDVDMKTASSLKELASSALQRVCNQSSESFPSVTRGTLYNDPIIVPSFSDRQTDACNTSTMSSNCSFSTIPKISYAQMAQKPNKTHLFKNDSENQRAFTNFCTDEAKKTNTDHSNGILDEINACQNDVLQLSIGLELKQEKEMHKTENAVDINGFIDGTFKPQKETYASKFVKTDGNVKVTDDTHLVSSTSATANGVWGATQSKSMKQLPSPKSSIIQVIELSNHKTKNFHQGEDVIQNICPTISCSSDEEELHLISDGSKIELKVKEDN